MAVRLFLTNKQKRSVAKTKKRKTDVEQLSALQSGLMDPRPIQSLEAQSHRRETRRYPGVNITLFNFVDNIIFHITIFNFFFIYMCDFFTYNILTLDPLD